MEQHSGQQFFFMQEAISLALHGMNSNEGGPFGAVVVKDGKIIGRGNNRVLSSNDPTAHAEMMAIKEACTHEKSFQLNGCEIYSSCEPCPMCMGAIYWARLDKLFYACTRKDAASIGFDDAFIYKELLKPLKERSIMGIQLGRKESLEVFRLWEIKEDKSKY